jgi:four helix bundle protein
MDVYALATRLCSNPAEEYIGRQMLRSSLGVGSKLHMASASSSPAEFQHFTGAALRELREAGSWLMIARRAGLLEKLSKTDLEKICQSLILLLTDYASKHA